MPRPLLFAALALAAAAPAPRYANPVIDQDFPDPAVLRVDGYVYLYATQGRDGGVMRDIQAARSRDGVRWEALPDALPVKPRWASRTQDFWAPHVAKRAGRYVMYYSAKPDPALTDPKRGLCLGVAVAARPEGPFTDKGEPLRCGESFINIDPMAFHDPTTGRTLLYWGSGFGPIRVQPLSADGLTFAPGSTAVELVQPVKDDRPDNYRRLVEGAWVIRRAGWYYLFFSGDNCCGAKAHYATLVARSRSATGPFEVHPTPVVAANARWIAPGHNSVLRDDAGVDWLVYHAVDARRPRETATDEVNTRRVTLIDRLAWRDGWPEVERGPSDGPRPGPHL